MKGRKGTNEVVDDVVSLHARSPGVVVADGVEETVLPDDGEDLAMSKGQYKQRMRRRRKRHTSSSMRARTRAEPDERRKLWSMKRGLKPVERR
jgi:hypothetical protein